MNKATVRGLLMRQDWPGIRRLAGHSRRVLSLLLGLTYDPDETVAWRAAEGLGVAAAVVADQDPEFVQGILRRLMWSLNDESGSIGWKSPQAMGAIVACRPNLFPEFAPLVISLLELEEAAFRPGTLWAMGRIGARDANLVRQGILRMARFLADPDPETRAYACWCAGWVGAQETLPVLQALAGDPAEVAIFEQGQLRRRTVGQVAQEAMARLSDPGEVRRTSCPETQTL